MRTTDTTPVRGRRSFPKGWVPFVLCLFATWNVLILCCDTVQIAPPAESGSGAIWSAVCFGLIGCVLGAVATRREPAKLLKSVLTFGGAAALGAEGLYGPATALVRGTIDFPASST